MSETNTGSLKKESLAQANNYLAVYLHRLLAKGKGNVFFSPFGISTAMAMVLFAAEGKTEAEMRKALGHDFADLGKDDIISVFQQQMSSLMENTDSYTLTSACSVITQSGFEVKERYKSVLEESFKALLLEVDFQTDTDKVVEQINDWAKEKTKEMIPHLIDSLDPTAVMILLNAVYFKGSWLRKFNEGRTSPHDFYNKGDKNQVKTVNMMCMKESLFIVERKTIKVLQLPYVGNEIAMLIFLPNEKKGLKALEKAIKPSFIHDLSQDMREKEVTVGLPRFRLEYSQSLVSFFKRLGIKKLFKHAELGGASDCKNLVVSEIFHKAVLDVNEDSSEAAADTEFDTGLLSATLSDPEFIVDHPFVFVIYDVKSSIILFMGRVEEL